MPQAPSLKGSLRIAPADESQLELILAFIRKLADYEKLSHQVSANEALLARWLFGPKPVAEAIFAYLDDCPVAFAIFFPNFSTFLGRPGLYLEDLFIEPAHRGAGIGKAMLAHLAKLATDRGYGRLEWAVLDWNEPAIEFYRKLGAEPLADWTIFRLTGDALTQAGALAP